VVDGKTRYSPAGALAASSEMRQSASALSSAAVAASTREASTEALTLTDPDRLVARDQKESGDDDTMRLHRRRKASVTPYANSCEHEIVRTGSMIARSLSLPTTA